MNRAENYIQKNRPALFDELVLGTSFLLGFIYPTLSDIIRSRWFSWWILAALLLYTAGALLKHRPLSYRLSRGGQLQPVPYILFLLVGHWFIILFAVILSESAFRELLKLPPLTEKNMASGGLIFTAITLAVVITWIVYRGKSKGKNRLKWEEKKATFQELVADLFLVAGVSIFSFVFWEKGVMAMLERAPARSVGDIWFLFVFLSVLFVFFYLPLRYLYFIENKSRRGNRIRLFLIFGFMLLRALFEMLRF